MVEVNEQTIALVVLAVGVVATYYKGVMETNRRLSETCIKQDVIWKIFEEQLPKLLVRPTHKEMDELLKKYVEHIATKEELIKLRDMINEELNEDDVDPMTKLKLSFVKPVLDHNISRAK